jgi:predicted RNA binding protein YcfA (HicA-like mRNA interferase family)
MTAPHRSRNTRDVLRRLREEGWIEARRGPGDPRQYKHPERPGRVTVDHGEPEIPTGTLRSIYRQAGWTW